ncbi:hypothetical protein MADA3029_300055 [Vibrio nigripulchritudo MADA3029]|nr:hypothetical protein VIBNIAM115_1050054 [Vibrio nigripulchritudo AM115]CCN40388.1 hypothetical protein VIBNIFTn2_1240038 [Vibrio nigripulchritudo FTn2]CCN54380.1 hypothetical protein VIBNIMADA3021_540054 [Vibrio nigripulchritudo MADA3021]CCN58979.1 hypothetical protein MADA3029_300055 [Vibrio nigripulchritudo MADA3029]CCN65269.1 hypothetical protein VIBNIPon4_370024 [Vibrio nigripulchritudo POn4]CCN77244.1 hypothetical protein VIBNISO65_220024 [Vibrio nigripulchritudo SO65]
MKGKHATVTLFKTYPTIKLKLQVILHATVFCRNYRVGEMPASCQALQPRPEYIP